MQERIVDELEDSVGDKDAWNRGVMVVLLDGEEAFGNWTEQNSLYGARCIPASSTPSLSNFSVQGADHVYIKQTPSKYMGANLSHFRIPP